MGFDDNNTSDSLRQLRQLYAHVSFFLLARYYPVLPSSALESDRCSDGIP